MMRTLTLLLFGCLALSPTTLAAECNGQITEIIVEDGSPGGQGLYVDDRSSEQHPINHWIYKEHNGEDDLQSGTDLFVFPDYIPYVWLDTCRGFGNAGPDLLIF